MEKGYYAITGCSNTAGQIGRFGKAVKLHPLSNSKVIRAVWLRAIRKDNFKPSKCTQLCYDHFPGGISRYWKYTVPVIHLRQNKNIQDVSRKIRKSKLQQIITFSTELTTVKMLATPRFDSVRQLWKLFTRNIRF